ncbi:hypothetical protein P8907_20630 [Bacillus atrophaeus]|uniref:hypothetical protein n=1 Tax=Bacillus atrophaeus TaxID=1452 RepID=UPI002281A378|nr:hypothetical protein [Bacillus atrophaeus]MCY8810631.1 hypothetical protein [Bacillus atrophaeus]MCY8907784.1 hypothetical protein [Bacillus atrophaeus]MEC0837789.1 hypothetical protein [Bacillus atrophaeus]MEC0847690.1 hypothetical protein [Bacillus atrophaeus]MEC0849910.1 hypothetical protein [Bacillus atrophaeus]
MGKVTEKQLRLIRDMELILNEKFTGDTIREASAFISRFMEEYEEAKEIAFDEVYYYDAY